MNASGKETSRTLDAVHCAVCGGKNLTVLEIGGLRRACCQDCQHSHRIDIQEYPYKDYAMGKNVTGSDRLESQAAFIRPHLSAQPAALEIGCAAGNLAQTLRSQHTFVRYDGIELSPAREAAAVIMDKVFDAPLTNLIDTGLIKSGSYQTILISHCLEHLEDLHREIEAMERALSPQGVIFIEVPDRSGNPRFPFDDNRSHLHFFSLSSLTRLLAEHGLEVISAQTGAWHDSRYTDCLRVIAFRYKVPELKKDFPLSSHRSLTNIDKLMVWGAGKMTEELLTHFFDLSRISCFIDSDPSKFDSYRLGIVVRSPQILAEKDGNVVLIGSLEYEDEISKQIVEQFGSKVSKIIRISELLSS